jgi:hypothetical protein
MFSRSRTRQAIWPVGPAGECAALPCLGEPGIAGPIVSREGETAFQDARSGLTRAYRSQTATPVSKMALRVEIKAGVGLVRAMAWLVRQVDF